MILALLFLISLAISLVLTGVSYLLTPKAKDARGIKAIAT